MIIGDKNCFAVQVDVEEAVDDWVFGAYLFWVKGVCIGRKDDRTVDLKGCWNWMRDFLGAHKDGFEPGLYEMNKEQIYTCLARSVLPLQNPDGLAHEIYKNTFSRFHITHIGMSSFDNVTLLFLKNERGMERLIWKSGDGVVEDAYLAEHALEDVFSEAVSCLRDRMASLGGSS